MEINSTKGIEIDSYINDNSTCIQHNKLAVQLKGERNPLEVYKLPVEFLIYNKRNGRFAAEIIHKQEEIGRELNPLIEEDRKVIRELLLKEEENATKLLKDDLIKVGQLEPGIITFDGVVINANRRMAVFEKLLEETSDPKFGFLTVARLPKSVDEKDIYRLEIDLQLSRPYRKDYGPINELLKLQEGIKIGLTPKQIANSLFGGFNEDEIKERLDRIKLIEDYLEYVEKPKKYEEVKGWHEHFIDLQAAILTFKKKKMSAKEIHYATIAGFELIIGGVPHMDVRKIKNLMTEKKTKESLMDSVETVFREKEEGTNKELKEVQPKEAQPKESQPEEVQPKEVQPKEVQPKEVQPKEVQPKEVQPKEVQPKEVQPKEVQPKEVQPKEAQPKEVQPKKVTKQEKIKNPVKITEKFKEDYQDILDTYNAHKESDKPKTLLRRALSNLESIDPKHQNLKDPEIINLLNSIAEIITKLLETK